MLLFCFVLLHLLWANYHGIYFARPPNLWWSSVYLMISPGRCVYSLLRKSTWGKPSHSLELVGRSRPVLSAVCHIQQAPSVHLRELQHVTARDFLSRQCSLLLHSFLGMYTMDESFVMLRGCRERVSSSSKLQFGESILQVKGQGMLCVHRPKTPVAEATQFVWHDAPPTPARLLACTPVVHEAPPSIWHGYPGQSSR